MRTIMVALLVDELSRKQPVIMMYGVGKSENEVALLKHRFMSLRAKVVYDRFIGQTYTLFCFTITLSLAFGTLQTWQKNLSSSSSQPLVATCDSLCQNMVIYDKGV